MTWDAFGHFVGIDVFVCLLAERADEAPLRAGGRFVSR